MSAAVTACAWGFWAAPAAHAEADPNFYIYLCVGQSNMEGASAPEAMDRVDIPDRFKLMAGCDFANPLRRTGNWYPALPPLVQQNSGLTPMDYFGRVMVEYLPADVRGGGLFFAHKDGDGCAVEIPVVADLVLQEAAVGVFYPLGQVAEEDKGGDLCAFQLGYVLDFDVFAFVGGWRCLRNYFEHYLVELRRGHFAAAVLVYVDGGLHHFEDALLGECRAENHGEVGERGKLSVDGLLKHFLSLFRAVLGDVPLVDAHYQALLVALDE